MYQTESYTQEFQFYGQTTNNGGLSGKSKRETFKRVSEQLFGFHRGVKVSEKDGNKTEGQAYNITILSTVSPHTSACGSGLNFPTIVSFLYCAS